MFVWVLWNSSGHDICYLTLYFIFMIRKEFEPLSLFRSLFNSELQMKLWRDFDFIYLSGSGSNQVILWPGNCYDFRLLEAAIVGIIIFEWISIIWKPILGFSSCFGPNHLDNLLTSFHISTLHIILELPVN